MTLRGWREHVNEIPGKLSIEINDGDTLMRDFEYDVFICHSSKDKKKVLELAKRLKSSGIRVWLDAWELRGGDFTLRRIEQGLEQSLRQLLIMSANFFASEWTTFERHIALFRDPTNVQRRFIPILLTKCDIADTLRCYTYVDLRKDYEGA